MTRRRFGPTHGSSVDKALSHEALRIDKAGHVGIQGARQAMPNKRRVGGPSLLSPLETRLPGWDHSREEE